ncbi:hypothetical protein F4808DRAFT_458938 [Astrocystis sublimbata]|nr:hypothetical protein F4808DRAFT_458938 [Astrocystis sublimbata]
MAYTTYSNVEKESNDSLASGRDSHSLSEQEAEAGAALWLLSLSLTWLLASVASHPRYDISLGLDTELEPLKSQIEIQRRTFTGDLDWDENGTLVRVSKPGALKYVGEPTPEIDANWDRLIFGDAVDIRGDDAKTVEGTTLQKPDGWWVLGIEVFHHLHCLNMLRKTLHMDYYGANERNMDSYTAHIEHCVDSLREALMCTSDLTPFPLVWNSKYRRPNFHFTVTEHTCRNFEKIRDWAVEHDADNHPVWHLAADGKKLGKGF